MFLKSLFLVLCERLLPLPFGGHMPGAVCKQLHAQPAPGRAQRLPLRPAEHLNLGHGLGFGGLPGHEAHASGEL